MRNLIYNKNKTASFEKHQTLLSIHQIQGGFTIVELMVTLAIAAIIISIAAPSFKAIIDNNRVTTATNDFTASIALAKTEAVKRNTNAQIIPTDGDWNAGYRIGIDLNDCDFTDTVDEVELKIVAAPPSGVTIDSDLTKVEYRPLGGITNAGSEQTIQFDADYACTRTITLSTSGTNTISKQSQPCF
jgi:prepilin-type N-terminal cleavage/methylation domain-containing protein